MSKRDDLRNEENAGKGILSALGLAAVGVIGFAIQTQTRQRAIQAEIEQLKLQRNHYENEFLGKFLYSEEIDAINSRIASLTDELRAL